MAPAEHAGVMRRLRGRWVIDRHPERVLQRGRTVGGRNCFLVRLADSVCLDLQLDVTR